MLNNKSLLKDYAIATGARFKVYDVLEDIYFAVDNLKMGDACLSKLVDDELTLGIKFKKDLSKHKYSIIVKPIELVKRYTIVNNINDVVYGIMNQKRLENELIKIIIDNNG